MIAGQRVTYQGEEYVIRRVIATAVDVHGIPEKAVKYELDPIEPGDRVYVLNPKPGVLSLAGGSDE